MFRCITEVKGLVFNLDSFSDTTVTTIASMFQDHKLLFMTSKAELVDDVERNLGKERLYKMERFQMLFAPNQETHLEVLKRLQLKASEVLYVSKNRWFLNNASGFMGGTVWITEEIEYEAASFAPDLICRNLEKFQEALQHAVEGFYGEISLFPKDHTRAGMIIPVTFPIGDDTVPLYMLGRYFGYSQYMSQLHPYSSAVYLNKREGKAKGLFDEIFSHIISKAVESVKRSYEVDGICAVPARPGKESRFKKILENVSITCGIRNYGESIRCVRDYPPQKGLSAAEREENIRGAFSFEGDITGKKIIVLDDIISTGSTIKECIDIIRRCGASAVYALALAVNQPAWNYWSSDPVQVSCPSCGNKMHLLVNSHNREFFYSCYDCSKTLDFIYGRQQIIKRVNSEFA